MSFTPAEIADGVWTHATRTVDALAPATSNGTVLDDIAYAVCTAASRTLDGGVATFSIQVAQTMPAPVQAGTLQTVMPVTAAQAAPVPAQASTAQTVMPVQVSQLAPAPTQAITAEAVVVFTIQVAQVAPAPAQSITAETQGGARPKPGGNAGFSYYPPIYAIRTNGQQESPAPGQRAGATFKLKVIEATAPIVEKATYSIGGVEYTLVPTQSAVLKSHRAVKNRDREDREILTLLASL